MKKDAESWIFLSIKLGVLVPSCQLRLLVLLSPEARTIEGTILQGVLFKYVQMSWMGCLHVVCMFGYRWFLEQTCWFPARAANGVHGASGVFAPSAVVNVKASACTSCAAHCAAHMLDITRSYLEDVGTKHSVPTTHIVSSSFVTFSSGCKVYRHWTSWTTRKKTPK